VPFTHYSWNGNVSTCNAGTTTAAHRNEVVDRINFYRILVRSRHAGIAGTAAVDLPCLQAGLPIVNESATKSKKCQKAALMMTANQAAILSNPTYNPNFPPKNAKCRNPNALAASEKGNLAIGTNGVVSNLGYVGE
jgi:hypothetical protein